MQDFPRSYCLYFNTCLLADEAFCLPNQDRGVFGERSARSDELLLLTGAEGFHQGHQHQASLPEDQHAARTPDGQSAA